MSVVGEVMNLNEAIIIRVEAAPPAKDGAKSILDPSHRHFPRVLALREAMARAMMGRAPFAKTRLRLEVEYHRANSHSDGLNIINGIADVIQRCRRAEMRHEVWVMDDDKYVVAFNYTELASTYDHYELVITRAP